MDPACSRSATVTDHALIVTVVTMSGTLGSVRCDSTTTVSGLKTLIHRQYHISPEAQSLLCGYDLMWNHNDKLVRFVPKDHAMIISVLRHPAQVADMLRMMRDGEWNEVRYKWSGPWKACLAIKEVALVAVAYCGTWLAYVHEDLRCDKDVVMQALQQCPDAMEFAHASLRDDKELVLVAVARDGRALRMASAALRSDVDVVRQACHQYSAALRWASRELLQNKEFIIDIVSWVGLDGCRDAFTQWTDDKDVVLAAVRSNGKDLWLASARLQDDKEVVLAAVLDQPLSLAFASRRLRDDIEVVLLAVQHDGYELRNASSRLRAETRVVRVAVLNYGLAIYFASYELRNDENIALEAVRQHPMALRFVSSSMQSNEEVVFAALQKDIRCIRYASQEMQSLFARGGIDAKALRGHRYTAMTCYPCDAWSMTARGRRAAQEDQRQNYIEAWTVAE